MTQPLSNPFAIDPPPPRPRRSRRTARQAGTRFERVMADYLAEAMNDDRIDRRPKTGSKDGGDIGAVRTMIGGRVVIECKDTSKLDVAGFLREAGTEAENDGAVAGVVIAKRRGIGDPGQQLVLMTVDDLVALLTDVSPR